MFFRDELLSWSWRRPLGMPSSTVAAGGIGQMDFEQKVTTNVDHVICRIKGIAPQSFTEEVSLNISMNVTSLVKIGLLSDI